jgi:CBS domain-containing protein
MMAVETLDPIRAMTKTEVVVVDEEATLREVATLLADEDIGAVIVRNELGMSGILSERDVTRAVAEGADPDLVWAADIMTPDPIGADVEDTVLAVAARMITANIRHLPVFHDAQPVGIVSARDIMRALADALRTRYC